MPMYNPHIDPLKEVDENILRRIQELHRAQQRATVVKLADMTGMTRASVYTSIRRLEQKGDIEENAYERARRNDFKLTASGEERASRILMRHDMVLNWLKRLGIPDEEAEDEACHMEHGLTDNTLAAIKKHVDTAMERMVGLGDLSCGGAPSGLPSEFLDLFRVLETGDAASTLKDAIQDAGGLDPCFQQLALLQDLLKKYGGRNELITALELLGKIGDLSSLVQLLSVVRDAGNLPAVIALLDKERRLWRSLLCE